MARKRPSISRPMLFIWLMLGSLIFFLSPSKITNKIHFAFIHFFRPVLALTRGISLSVLPGGDKRMVVSRANNERLKNYTANLEAELHEEHQKVEKLSDLRSRYAMENASFVVSDVITGSADSLKLDINRGLDDGLALGQFVLSDNSVVGVISAISATSAKVSLVTDTSRELHVKIATSDAYIHGLMAGDGKGAAKVRYIQRKHIIQKGDYVYACKQPGLLDLPILVGTVARCGVDDDNPLLWEITVEPACDIQRLKHVAVVVMPAAGED